MTVYSKAGKYGSVLLGVLLLLATALSLVPGPEWWIRIFDYPRVQIAVLLLVVLVLSFFFFKANFKNRMGWMLLLSIAFLYQMSHILVYTPLYPKQALDSTGENERHTFSLLVTNVLMENRQATEFLALVKQHQPDLILVTEPNHWWQQQLKPLEKEYAYRIESALENTYGMLFYSKLPLVEKELNFLVESDVPSVFAQVQLPSGAVFDFYGLHPRPPLPGSDTYERDAEILLVGKKVKIRNRPALVAGDMNDVAWSQTSDLFQRYSGLLDPRQGRGLYNTFDAHLPILRYPLDHVYYSEHFGFNNMLRLDNFGSDHFPILISLTFAPAKDNAQDKPEPEKGDAQKANRMIEKGT